jgi:hypothetical protein
MTKEEAKLRELMGSASLHFDLLCAVIKTRRTLKGTASAATKLDLIEKATAGILPPVCGRRSSARSAPVPTTRRA